MTAHVWWRCRCGNTCARVVYAADELSAEAVAVRSMLDLAPDVGGWAALCAEHGVIAWGLDGGALDLGLVREEHSATHRNDFSMFFEEFERGVRGGIGPVEMPGVTQDWVRLDGGTIDGGVIYGDGTQAQFHIEPDGDVP